MNSDIHLLFQFIIQYYYIFKFVAQIVSVLAIWISFSFASISLTYITLIIVDFVLF